MVVARGELRLERWCERNACLDIERLHAAARTDRVVVAAGGDDVAAVGKRRERVDELLAPRFDSERNGQWAAGQAEEIPRGLCIGEERRPPRVVKVAGDLRSREQRVAFGAGWPERVDEARSERIEQPLLRDVPAREVIALPVLAVENRRVVVPAGVRAFEAEEGPQRARIDVVDAIAERNRSISQIQVTRNAVLGGEGARVVRTPGRITERLSPGQERAEDRSGGERKRETIVRIARLGEELMCRIELKSRSPEHRRALDRRQHVGEASRIVGAYSISTEDERERHGRRASAREIGARSVPARDDVGRKTQEIDGKQSITSSISGAREFAVGCTQHGVLR